MNKVAALVSILLFSCPTVFGQDAVQYGVKHLTVLAEDQKVRVCATRRTAGTRLPSIPTHRLWCMCSKGEGLNIDA
jgi:hypothetical protein